jgi:hypothetical protein
MLRELIELYALRAREYYETVSRLGRHGEIGPELRGLMEEIKRRRTLCDETAEKLDRYVESASEQQIA